MREGSGLFVAIDGPNGVGKSTLLEIMVRSLRQRGLGVHKTQEVTETKLGKFIRGSGKMYRGKTLALLIAADRQNHIERDIAPALESHDIVITDRYVGSSLVFQKLDGVELPFLWKINADFLKPQLTIIILASPDIIATRLGSRSAFDRFEASFSREEEVRLFAEAASFLEVKGYTVYRFFNERVSIMEAAEKLAGEILHVRARHIESVQRRI